MSCRLDTAQSTMYSRVIEGGQQNRVETPVDIDIHSTRAQLTARECVVDEGDDTETMILIGWTPGRAPWYMTVRDLEEAAHMAGTVANDFRHVRAKRAVMVLGRMLADFDAGNVIIFQ